MFKGTVFTPWAIFLLKNISADRRVSEDKISVFAMPVGSFPVFMLEKSKSAIFTMRKLILLADYFTMHDENLN